MHHVPEVVVPAYGLFIKALGLGFRELGLKVLGILRLGFRDLGLKVLRFEV